MNKSRWLTKKEAETLGLEVKENEQGRKNARYRITEEDWLFIYQNRITPNKRKFIKTILKKDKNDRIISTTEKLQSKPVDIPENFEVIKISTSETTGQQWIQYAPKKEIEDIKELDFEAIVKKHIKPVEIKRIKTKIKTDTFQVVTYTDTHIGMDTDKYKNSMYPIKWDKDEVMTTAKNMVEIILKEKNTNTLYIDDLGDLLDGFNAQTTRRGHDLPQNMTNTEAFDTALEFKMYLADHLTAHYEKVVFNNICNDNHAGDFGYFANEAYKNIAETKYNNVEVTNYRQFINHYFVNDICFILTHGKDDKHLKFGFKPQLKTDALEKIDQYIKHNEIYQKAKLIVFKKGDSHQLLLDMCSSDDFYYFNYPALSPSSQWVQTNFKKGRKGFLMEFYTGLDICIKPFL